jgi:transaldolase
MSANPLLELASFGQSGWLDQMRRSLLSSGELKRLIEEDGLRGLTSNPTIFEKAIAGSNDYTGDLRRLAKQGASVEAIYEHLTLEDIRGAADLFRGVHESSQGGDGFVSLEVSPLLAHDTAKTIQEAKALFAKLARPNVMIKVPATPEGIPAIEELIAAGLNVNVTLMFSVAVYEKVAEAYLRGLERRVAAGEAVDRIASVASFFVSRIDTAVDRELERLLSQAREEKQKSRVNALHGKAAIANAKLAYGSFRRIFRGKRWEALKAKGARPQRPLWASTSTKNPAYSDVLYVESLIGPDTVDTIPPQTLDAFRDHGRAAATLETGMDEARAVFRELKTVGVDFQEVTDRLTAEGVEKFADSFRQLLDVMRARRDEATSCLLERQRASLGKYDLARTATLQRLQDERFMGRMWTLLRGSCPRRTAPSFATRWAGCTWRR